MKLLQILVLMFSLFIFVNAQKAHLSGTVTDEFGAVIPNATVEAKNNKSESFSARTNDEGQYRLELIEDAYQIAATRSPFNKFTVSDYWVSNKMQLDVVLQCKEGCDRIGDRFEESPLIETTKAAISNEILQKPLENLPKKQNKSKRKFINNKQ